MIYHQPGWTVGPARTQLSPCPPIAMEAEAFYCIVTRIAWRVRLSPGKQALFESSQAQTPVRLPFDRSRDTRHDDPDRVWSIRQPDGLNAPGDDLPGDSPYDRSPRTAMSVSASQTPPLERRADRIDQGRVRPVAGKYAFELFDGVWKRHSVACPPSWLGSYVWSTIAGVNAGAPPPFTARVPPNRPTDCRRTKLQSTPILLLRRPLVTACYSGRPQGLGHRTATSSHVHSRWVSGRDLGQSEPASRPDERRDRDWERHRGRQVRAYDDHSAVHGGSPAGRGSALGRVPIAAQPARPRRPPWRR